LMIFIVLYHSLLFWAGNWFTLLSNHSCVEVPTLANVAFYLNSFHIYTFVFLSGYLFYYLYVEQQKYQKFTSFVVKKAKRLLVPYIFVCLLWVIPFFVFFGGYYTDILHKFILGESPEQLWFLLMLFGVFIVFYIVYQIQKKLTEKLKIKFPVLILLLCFILPVISVAIGKYIPNIYRIWSIGRFFPVFVLGFYTRQGCVYKQLYIDKISLCIYLVLQILLFIFSDYIPHTFSGELLRFLVQQVYHLLGAFTIFHLLAYIIPNIFIKTLSKTSFGVYLFHQQIICLILFLTVPKLSPYLITLLCFIGSYTVSGIITYLLLKTRYTRWIIGSK